MIQPGQDFFYNRLYGAKIDAHSQFVQLGAPHEHLDFPVVPVDPGAVAGVSPKAVSSRKAALYEDFKNFRHRVPFNNIVGNIFVFLNHIKEVIILQPFGGREFIKRVRRVVTILFISLSIKCIFRQKIAG
ncbi:hypothetical protein SBDP1_1290005 [Syntrophobacter sp. SbD1]|nr:hypothetical protein SBDP1_1290005 [Syntrophobacter sp. SbD1]